MLDKYKGLLWDITTFFVTGVLILLNAIYYGQLESIRSYISIGIFSGEVIKGIYMLIITYTAGLVFEPLANVTFGFLAKPYSKLPWNNRLEKLRLERDSIYEPLIIDIIQMKYGFTNSKTDYFQIAKVFLYQKGIPELYLTFLSRFGLYRNITVLTLINIPILIYVNRFSLSAPPFLITITILTLIHFLIFKRAREFYFYAGNEIYRHYILQNKMAHNTQNDDVVHIKE